VVEQERDAAAAALQEAQEALNYLAKRNARREIDDATFDATQPELVRERDAARQRLEAATEALHQHALAGAHLATIQAFCQKTAAQLDDLEKPENFDERQALVRTVVQRIEVRSGRPVALYGRLGASDDGPNPLISYQATGGSDSPARRPAC
jgi:Rad3-related DNA helicase